jgi:hypothetical protein
MFDFDTDYDARDFADESAADDFREISTGLPARPGVRR